MSENSIAPFFNSTILGHPSRVFVLFFTEMWERFFYYGMRASLVLFLTAPLMMGVYFAATGLETKLINN